MTQLLDSRQSNNRYGGPAFALSNRIRRAAWMTAWLVLARWTPPPLHAWRVLVLRLFGLKGGRGCRIWASTKVWDPANLRLGDNVMIGPGAILYNQGKIAIGRDTVISQRAHLCASSHRIGDPHFQLVLKPIEIGADCWVATEAFVGPGVTMHDGAVLAARGALFGDAESDTVYRGNPAVEVAKRRWDADDAA